MLSLQGLEISGQTVVVERALEDEEPGRFGFEGRVDSGEHDPCSRGQTVEKRPPGRPNGHDRRVDLTKYDEPNSGGDHPSEPF
jgi:hypothetical protein